MSVTPPVSWIVKVLLTGAPIVVLPNESSDTPFKLAVLPSSTPMVGASGFSLEMVTVAEAEEPLV